MTSAPNNSTPSSSSGSSEEPLASVVKAPSRSSLWVVSPEVASYFVGEWEDLSSWLFKVIDFWGMYSWGMCRSCFAYSCQPSRKTKDHTVGYRSWGLKIHIFIIVILTDKFNHEGQTCNIKAFGEV